MKYKLKIYIDNLILENEADIALWIQKDAEAQAFLMKKK